jgi:hypothetical protein
MDSVKNDVRIVVLGSAGVGKSALVPLALFLGDGFQFCLGDAVC